ncbi:pentapeptide repeat-containing protein [Nocardiopsis dassonvillei]|nr:pentapeptide repeat-containing protein [Nocardiopsis dassonvillei]
MSTSLRSDPRRPLPRGLHRSCLTRRSGPRGRRPLRSRDLGGADLSSPDLSGANLRGANLRRTDRGLANAVRPDRGQTGLVSADRGLAGLVDGPPPGLREGLPQEQTVGVGEGHRVVVGVGVPVHLLGVAEVHDRIRRDERPQLRCVGARPEPGQADLFVDDSADEPARVGPGPTDASAVSAESGEPAPDRFPGEGVDRELACLVVVGEDPVHPAVVGAAGDDFTGVLVETGGLRDQVFLVVLDLHAGQEQRDHTAVVADQPLALGVVDELRGVLALVDGRELALGVPLQRLCAVAVLPGGHVPGLVVGVGSGSASTVGVHPGHRVRTLLPRPGTLVGPLDVAAVNESVAGLGEAVAEVVVGVTVPVRRGAAHGLPGRGGVTGLFTACGRGPLVGEAAHVVVGEALHVRQQALGGGFVPDAQHVAGRVVGVGLVDQRPMADLVAHPRGEEPLSARVVGSRGPGGLGLGRSVVAVVPPLHDLPVGRVRRFVDVIERLHSFERASHRDRQAQLVVGVADELAGQPSCRGQCLRLDGAVGVIGAPEPVGPAQSPVLRCGGDADRRRERPAHGVVGGDGRAVLQSIGMPGGTGQFALGDGVEGPRGEQGTVDSALPLFGLTAEFVVGVDDRLVPGVGPGHHAVSGVVDERGRAPVGLVGTNLAPPQVVVVAPDVARLVGHRLHLPRRGVGVGQSGVVGFGGVALVLAHLDGLAARVLDRGGGDGARSRCDQLAVTAVLGRGPPQLLAVGHGQDLGRALRAVVDCLGVPGDEVVVAAGHVLVAGHEDVLRGRLVISVGVAFLDLQTTAVVEGVGDQASAAHTGLLTLAFTQQPVVDLVGRGVAALVVAGVGRHHRGGVISHVVLEPHRRIVIGLLQVGSPYRGQASQGVVGHVTAVAVGVDLRHGQPACGIEVLGGGVAERVGGGDGGRRTARHGGRVVRLGDVAERVGLGDGAPVGVVFPLLHDLVGGGGAVVLHDPLGAGLQSDGGGVSEAASVEEGALVADQVVGVGGSRAAADRDLLRAGYGVQDPATGVVRVGVAGALVVVGVVEVTVVVGLGDAAQGVVLRALPATHPSVADGRVLGAGGHPRHTGLEGAPRVGPLTGDPAPGQGDGLLHDVPAGSVECGLLQREPVVLVEVAVLAARGVGHRGGSGPVGQAVSVHAAEEAVFGR